MIRLPLPAYKALRRLTMNGFRAYIVGGCVRDLLLGREPNDYDITTNALPQQITAIFSDFHVIHTGIKHGTVTVFIEDEPVEITTHRVEGRYSDMRHPDSIVFTQSLNDDLARRDFTVNAIAYSPDEGIIDPFGGTDDLKKKLIRAVGNPDERFSEDALRIIRAVRFSAQLDFQIERNTAASAIRLKNLLHKIAYERVASELSKTIVSVGVLRVLTDYREVISEILPVCRAISDDEYLHNAKAVSLLPKVTWIRFAALMHERAKDNETSAAADVIAQLKTLRFDNNTVMRTAMLVDNYNYPFVADRKKVKLAFYRLTPEVAIELINIRRADMIASGSNAVGCAYIDEILKTALDIASSDEAYCLSRLKFTGRDAANLGATGREIGVMLDVAMRAVINEDCENDRDAIREYLSSVY